MSGVNPTENKVQLVDVPPLRLDEGPYHLPPTERVHRDLVQFAVESEIDLCILTPTLHQAFLDNHALAALFQNIGEITPVFIISPNRAVRDQYEQLRNGLHYSTAKWPLATVKADNSLHYRTEHARSPDAPPGVIYTPHTTRLPPDHISQQTRGVLYDDAAKFDDERWATFQDWRARNDVPAIIYFIRDPLGPFYQRVKDEVSFTWVWTPNAISSTLSASGLPEDQTHDLCPRHAEKEYRFLKHKVSGQTHRVHLCDDGPVVDAFDCLWQRYEELEKASEDIDEGQLYAATEVAERAINSISRLLTKIRYSDNYRAGHAQAKTISGRIGQVRTILNQLQGDAAAGYTPVEKVHHQLEQVKETLIDAEPATWKRGGVLSAFQKVVDDDEELAVVVPDEPDREALQAELQIEHEDLYSIGHRNISLHTPKSLPATDPVDYLLLYGPPKYDHRWLLRSPHAPYVGVLAYPHELGLLYTQVKSLNDIIRQATPHPGNEPTESADLIRESITLPPLLPETTDPQAATGDSPTDCGVLDGVSIEIPDPDDSETDSEEAFDGYRFGGQRSTDSINEIIRNVTGPRGIGDVTYTPSSSADTDEDTTENRQSVKIVKDCVDIRTESGKAIAYRPGGDVEVVNPGSGTTVEKPVTAVQPREQVVAVHDRDAIRTAVEEFLLESGYIDMVGYARLWKNQLQTEIDRHDDSLEEFKDRLEAEGLDKYDSTYEQWYNDEVRLPKAKASLYAIAEAYDMEEVLADFEKVWKYNHDIRQIKNDLIELLKDRARGALADRAEGDPVIDEDLDIRLSDFEATDDAGTPYVEVHTVASVETGVSLPKTRIGRWRSLD